MGRLAAHDLEIEARRLGVGEHSQRGRLADIAARAGLDELERDIGLGDQRRLRERDRVGERVDGHDRRVGLDARAGYEQPSPAIDVCDRRDVGHHVRRGRGGVEVAAPRQHVRRSTDRDAIRAADILVDRHLGGVERELPDAIDPVVGPVEGRVDVHAGRVAADVAELSIPGAVDRNPGAHRGQVDDQPLVEVLPLRHREALRIRRRRIEVFVRGVRDIEVVE